MSEWKLPPGDEKDLRTIDGKQLILDEYFSWRGKNDPKIIKQIRYGLMMMDEGCGWCEPMKNKRIKVCLNCGKKLIS